ncbi:hypothetical protein HYU21_03325, partial [Candidatus Woesearchaeota archaeon]|nr:hypothetical protein [Candidatus Woesearchaeota archaeon]
QGPESEFDGPGTAVADLLETTPTQADNTSSKENPDTLIEIMEQYIKDYAILIGEKSSFLASQNLTVSSEPIEPQQLAIYVPYLRFGKGMVLKTAPLSTQELSDFIGRTDADLAYLIEHADLLEKGLLKDGFNLESDKIKTTDNQIIWAPADQDALSKLSRNCSNNIAIPNFYFLSLFIENGEVLRNYLKYLQHCSLPERDQDKYNKTHYFYGAYYNGRDLRFKGANPLNITKVQLSIPELRKFAEATGEKRIAGLITEIPDFYSTLSNYGDFSNAKDFLYVNLKKHTPQLTI